MTAKRSLRSLTKAQLIEDNERLADEAERLRRSLTEALEQQTATAEILRVISSSPTDLQPVLDAMAESATRLCASYDANIFRLDGDVLRLVAHHGPLVVPLGHVVSAIRGTVTGRAVLDRQTVQAADLQTEVDEFPESSTTAQELGYRTTLGVPLLREGKAIGAISLRRTEVQPVDFDPVAAGYVGSLAHPGANMTGVIFQERDLTAKRLDVLMQALPKTTRVAVLWDNYAAEQVSVVMDAARRLNLQAQPIELRQLPYDYEGALKIATRGRAQALLVLTSPVVFRDREHFAKLAVQSRVPTMLPFPEIVEAGGLMSYGPNLTATFDWPQSTSIRS